MNYYLTERERQVLDLCSRGHVNKEIARTIGLSIFTVKAHKRTIRMKIGTDGFKKAVFRNG